MTRLIYSETFWSVVGFCIAVLVIYAVAPGIASLISPEVGAALWDSPISNKAGATVFGAILLAAVLLIVANAYKTARAGGQVVPTWLIVCMAAGLSLLITIAGAYIIFGVSNALLISFGIETAVAAIVAFLLTCMIMWLFR